MTRLHTLAALKQMSRAVPCDALDSDECAPCRRVGLCVPVARLRATFDAATVTTAGVRFPRRWNPDGRPVYRVPALLAGDAA
jgi:hypothetical protein